MKKLILILGMAAIAAGALQAKEIRTVTVTTEPQLHCANCEAKVKKFFKFEKGIKKIDASAAKQQVTITYDADKTSEQKIIESFGKINYKATKKAQPENEK